MSHFREGALKIGTVYHYLTIIGSRIMITKHSQPRGYYPCRCKCGKEKLVRSDTLRKAKRNHRISCGCIVGKRNKGEASFNACYGRYKRVAKERGYYFNLTKEEFKSLVTKDCIYCLDSPKNKSGQKANNGYFVYTGLDRKNNTLGYDVSNSVPCCLSCNRAKNDMGMSEFIDWIKKVYYNLSNFEHFK